MNGLIMRRRIESNIMRVYWNIHFSVRLSVIVFVCMYNRLYGMIFGLFIFIKKVIAWTFLLDIHSILNKARESLPIQLFANDFTNQHEIQKILPLKWPFQVRMASSTSQFNWTTNNETIHSCIFRLIVKLIFMYKPNIRFEKSKRAHQLCF